MNKQEALEALLVECRQYEQPHEEVRRAALSEVGAVLISQAQDLEVMLNTETVAVGTVQRALARLAGAALYLMVDEVEVVEVLSLEERLGKKLEGATKAFERYSEAALAAARERRKEARGA